MSDELAALVKYRLEQAHTALNDAKYLLDGGRSPHSIINRAYCAVHNLGDSSYPTAQSGGESEEGRRSTPLGRARGEG